MSRRAKLLHQGGIVLDVPVLDHVAVADTQHVEYVEGHMPAGRWDAPESRLIDSSPGYQARAQSLMGQASDGRQGNLVELGHRPVPEVPVENGSGPERLAATRECVIVFRLVVETTGHVLYGEILEPPSNGRHRFVGTIGLIEAVREWLREAISQPDRGDEPSPEVADTEHGPVD